MNEDKLLATGVHQVYNDAGGREDVANITITHLGGFPNQNQFAVRYSERSNSTDAVDSIRKYGTLVAAKAALPQGAIMTWIPAASE